ncbi:EAL domain-containing protein [Pontibacillus litoralis]|uniref:Diguanylate cyclase n=1 Tax=Pontibacillus litoralis JSM 072002 TaxID=1385512 RepID=A0A0A5G9T3_9BACI|nr:EAL domain-containing protein [Pontibacillus litoralis]KGX88809.1 diguanylate cyclase [Pontibacillus litoralis JSM 072002]
MDPIDVMEQIDKVKPSFQPIFTAIKYDVIGYEVLGRIEEEGEYESLGPFFVDPQVPEEFKLELDDYLLTQAVQQLWKEQDDKSLLFINRSAQQLMWNGEQLIQTLSPLVEQGFSYNRIVLEITEHDFDEDFESLAHLLLYYKTFGIQIAVDHVGAKSSNLDRLRQLEPHILKIDSKILHDADLSSHHDILYSISMLAKRIGAALLFENIEDDIQLYYAWKHGGRYYQGFYLKKPCFSFPPTQNTATLMKNQFDGFIRREKKLIEDRIAFILNWDQRMRGLLDHWEGAKKVDAFIERVTHYFDEESFRMYVCNSDGQQISSNFRKYNNEWVKQPEIIGTNWAFRPYFLENIVQMRTWNKGRLSDLYSDIDTRAMVRTFSFPLSDHFSIFIDIQYAYIFEHECLLI